MEEILNQIPDNSYNKGAIEMLRFIAKNEGWEESEEYYLKEYFKNVL